LPQDVDNVSVCNLASINLSMHLLDGAMDWAKIDESARIAVRQLDNLIDITRSSVAEADFSNQQNRAVGLGVMGFTDIIERLGFSYESEEAYDLIDEIMEHISYAAIDESANLAQERGSYANFEGSRWSQGMVPLDTIDLTEADRGVAVEVNRTTRLDWDALREKVKGGMRNATLMAIAPTASIGLVAGTTPGLDPQFSQIFSRSTSSGKFLEINRNLVEALRERGLWESTREDILRSQGDIQGIESIPQELKDIYKTSFQLSPFAFLEVAARAQKWIDQAISRNMYLETRDIDDLMSIYSGAWKRGVKTTYYLHMKPRHTAEQSTVKVNKSAQVNDSGASTPRKGFGAAPKTTQEPVAAAATPKKGFGFGSTPQAGE
jgi:ribonucleoside-diphosphate reductase alpha chain